MLLPILTQNGSHPGVPAVRVIFCELILGPRLRVWNKVTLLCDTGVGKLHINDGSPGSKCTELVFWGWAVLKKNLC